MNISGPAAVAKPEMLFYAPGDLTVTVGSWHHAPLQNKKPNNQYGGTLIIWLGETYLILAVQANLNRKYTVFLFRVEVTMVFLNDTVYIF